MKKKMFIAGTSLVIALVLLATASFAWFTISTSPEVKGMNVALYTDRTLLLATDENGKPGSFDQYISLSNEFAGLAPLRPVSTLDGVNWFLPAYDTDTGELAPVNEFILDNTLEHANISVTENGTPLTGDALLEAQSRGYYVYTDLWMKTEEASGARVRLSVPHVYGTTEERHAGETSEFGLDSEELAGAVYGTYVLGEPELDAEGTGIKERLEEPETALRIGFLVYQDPDTLEPVDGPDEDTKLAFKIFEPNGNKRTAGIISQKVLESGEKMTVVEKENYISGGMTSSLNDNFYYATSPIAVNEMGKGSLGTIDPANLIVQLAGRWDEDSLVETLSGNRENGFKKPSSNDVEYFGTFLKVDERYTQSGSTVNCGLLEEDEYEDIAGQNVIVELKEDTPIKVRLFVWIEGQDVDCWNDIATGTFRINLELAGETIEDEEEEEPEAVICTLKGYGEAGDSPDGWFYSKDAGITRGMITELEFTDKAPQVSDKNWNAGTGTGDEEITAYLVDTKVYIVVPDGAERIRLPEDSGSLFSSLSNCSSIIGLKEYVDTSDVTDMSGMFYYCDNLKEMDLSGFDTSRVTKMQYMFASDSDLTSLDLNSFNTSNVTTMDSMFDCCSSMETLDLSSFDTSNLSVASYMFAFCRKLETIYAGDGFDASHFSYCDSMFEDAVSLVGGNGTEYDEDYIDHTYARIDGGTESPGYFTAK